LKKPERSKIFLSIISINGIPCFDRILSGNKNLGVIKKSKQKNLNISKMEPLCYERVMPLH
jgi:hypothetical protein